MGVPGRNIGGPGSLDEDDCTTSDIRTPRSQAIQRIGKHLGCHFIDGGQGDGHKSWYDDCGICYARLSLTAEGGTMGNFLARRDTSLALDR